jgi:hypothetical protein
VQSLINALLLKSKLGGAADCTLLAYNTHVRAPFAAPSFLDVSTLSGESNSRAAHYQALTVDHELSLTGNPQRHSQTTLSRFCDVVMGRARHPMF